ncbi:MAG: DNA translocase FtsK 4TM domain-containing protein [Bacteroidota bacterium]
MGKKKTTQKTKKVAFFQDERVQIILGIVFIGISAYLMLAFVSFLFTWKADQSFEWNHVLSEASIQVENWAGKLGARIANKFLNHLFGIASFALPFLLFIIGMRFFKIRVLPLRKTIKVTIITAALASLFLAYLFGAAHGYMGSGLGGGYGYHIVQWLNALMGKVGTALLLLTMLLAFLIFALPQSLFFLQKWGAYILDNKERLSEIEEEKKKQNPREAANAPKEQNETEQVNSPPTPEAANADDDFVIETTDDEPIATGPAVSLPQQPPETPKQEDKTPDTQQEDNGIELTIEERKEQEKANGGGVVAGDNFDPKLDLSQYQLPVIELLDDHESNNPQGQINKEEIIANKNRIVETLANYKIQIDKIKATIGPTVTLYEIIPAPGVRISKIKNLEDDIALSLAALGIRIIAPIPGRGTIGIEVPNQNPETVSMKSVLSSKKFRESNHQLALALGKTISNETFVIDLAKMPHLLVAGATGQGKSVGLNAIIASLLYRMHPAQLKFVLIDPKKVELTLYNRIEKHFLAHLPDAEEAIITDTQKVVTTLNSLCVEMDRRYDLLKAAHVRNIKEYNQKFVNRRLNPDKGHRYLPYIVVIVDEFADLIMTAGKEIEGPIARLAQLARAIGIHLIIATQRPSTNIITGVIKANFPARIAFRVTSMVDSRTILDSPGANQLIGRGDMLISTGSDLTRLQCAFVDTDELERITEFIGSQQGYTIGYELPEYVGEEAEAPGEVDLKKRDAMFEDAARLVVRHQQGSTSLIQRKFSIGYNRAGRIVDQLEAAGIVGPFEGSKARQVLYQDEYSLEQYLNNMDTFN